ncbi:hypothetical protein ACFLZB_02370 [Nanoarchaeota archaeon]
MPVKLIQPRYILSRTEKVGPESEAVIAYSIDYVENQPKGAGVLYFNTLTNLKTGRKEEKELLLALQHIPHLRVDQNPTTLVAQVEEFFPNGRKLTPEQLEQYSRKGTGSILLKFMELDARNENAKVLYGISTTKEGMNFFGEKKDFNDVGFKLPYLFYKLL